MGGSLYGQRVASIGNYEIYRSFNDLEPNPLVSRYSLRGLPENSMHVWIENYLHAVRMLILTSGMTFRDVLKLHNKMDSLNRYKQIIDNEYFNKLLKI